MSDDIVERVGVLARCAASALSISAQMRFGDDPAKATGNVLAGDGHTVVFTGTMPECQNYINRHVGRAALAALEAAGYAVVPVVPTEAMIEEVWQVDNEFGKGMTRDVWTAMLKVSRKQAAGVSPSPT